MIDNFYSNRTAHSSRPNPNQAGSDGVPDLDIDPNEPTYCYCNQVSFGDMVACDSESVSILGWQSVFQAMS